MFALSPSKKTVFSKRAYLWICLFLIGAVGCVYSGVINFDFIIFDDTQYISGNPNVRTGMTAKNIAWSFSFDDKEKTYWLPLTWISHMLDVELYGMNPGRHHLSNVLFHIAGTLLLFLALHRMTGALWRSAFVAALFAIHPINVESAAWIAERKNVLSTSLGMLTLFAYASYDERPTRLRYLTVLFVFSLSLLAKPMLVTLPFVLLLLDYWPLAPKRKLNPNGIYERTLRHLILEKIPLLVLSGLSVYLASSSLRGVGSYMPLESMPMTLRIANALVSYMKYMGKMVWPANLAIFYPYPASLPLWQIIGASIILAAVSIWVLCLLKKHAYLAVGWFWFVGTLIPVSGLVQAGLWPAMADRWAYVPLIGLFIMMAWGAKEIADCWQWSRVPLVSAALAILLILAIVARIQVGYWANSITIFEHAITATGGSWVAHNNLGRALSHSGNTGKAYDHYAAALEYNPHSAHIHVNFGSALLARGKIDQAIEHFEHALKLDSGFAEAYNNLGLAHVRRGDIKDAVYFFRRAVQKNPRHANAQQNLKLALSIQEKINRTVRRMRASLKIDPAEPGLDLKMSELSDSKRELVATLKYFQTALARQPGYIRLEENKISVVSTLMREYEGMLPLLLEAIKIKPASADTSYHLACLYSRKGRVAESAKWLNTALASDPSKRDFFLADPDLKNLDRQSYGD